MSIRKIYELLEHCTSTCHTQIPDRFIPTRLIDVGQHASNLPRLVLSSEISKFEQTKYAALSYCWGNEKDAESQFKTEKASLEDRRLGMPSELMTATISDAIALTRVLSLRYLWIDALCIIQDDNDDWLHESSQMNLVYRHAFVTFCTLNSDSCHEGFLNRGPVVEVPFQSTIRSVIKGSFLVRLCPRMSHYVTRTKYRCDANLSEWDKRCWTFQEEKMSTRTLLFGSLNMHFACTRTGWSEGDEAPRPRFTLGVIEQITKFKDNRISSRDLYDSWGRLAEDYSSRLITFEKDRLSAIAGLARMFGDALQDRYLAGHWQGDLHYGLTWCTYHHMVSRSLEAHIRNIRERDYVAPSWSWASCPRALTLNHLDTFVVEESTIVDANTDTESEHLYGQVSGGFLRIRGKMARMPHWSHARTVTWWSSGWVGMNRNCDCCVPYRFFVAIDWVQESKDAEFDILVAMLLHRLEFKDQTKPPRLRALLLYPADELNCYYRVGVISSDGTHDGNRGMRTWFENSKEETICIV